MDPTRAVNDLFFGLRRGSDEDNTVSEPFDTLFQTFMETSLHDSGGDIWTRWEALR